MDVKGSKYLYTTGTGTETKSEENVAGLYSVDENGEASLVLSQCYYADSTEVTINLSIVPTYMYNLHNKYLYIFVEYQDHFEINNGGIYNVDDTVRKDNIFHNSRFYMDQISAAYGDPGVGQISILVRIKDGKMFYLPIRIQDTYFNSIHQLSEEFWTSISPKGDIYISRWGNLAVIQENSDQLTITGLNPNGTEWCNPKVVNNGSVFLRPYRPQGTNKVDDYCLLYPDGGLEFFDNTFESFRNQTEKREGYYLYFIDGEIKALKATEISEYKDDEHQYTENVELYDFNVGTSYGSCSFGEPIASYTRQSTSQQEQTRLLEILSPMGEPILSDAIDSETHALLGDTFVWDKTSDELIMLEQETHDILVAMESNQAYDGKLWSLDHQVGGKVVVSSFHMATQTTNTETYDIGAEVGGFRMRNYTLNMGNGTSILNGTRLSDGKSIVVTLEFSTGQISVSENEDAANITNLVPMN